MEDAGDDAYARSPIAASWPPRLPGESDAAFARSVIDPGPLPVHLPYDPDSCFVTLTDTKWIDIDCLHGREPVLPEATFWHNAAKRMAAACAGVIGRRGAMDGDGCLCGIVIRRAWSDKRPSRPEQGNWPTEEVHLHAYDSVSAAKAGIARYLAFDNRWRPHRVRQGRTPDVW